ncbi:MAG: hypothetical protein MI723_07900, partial [Caulobacterales bacterium]|nr:hypothetical protein [Caulobacterales bacterium]
PVLISGPGNQFVGLKEALMAARRLKRTLVLPPFLTHYSALRRKERTVFDFGEAFDESVLREAGAIAAPAEVAGLEGRVFLLRSEFDAYCQRAAEYYDAHCGLGVGARDRVVLERRTLRSYDDFAELEAIDDPLLVLCGVFNNIAVSPCRYNGCVTCERSALFAADYDAACKSLRYAPDILRRADAFIAERFGDRPFMAAHLRVADRCGGRRFAECFHGYDERAVFAAVLAHAERVGVGPSRIFVAAPPFAEHLTDLRYFRRGTGPFWFYEGAGEASFIASLVEQAICYRSAAFVKSITNKSDAAEIPAHPRSTWNMFVADLRRIEGRDRDDAYLNALVAG